MGKWNAAVWTALAIMAGAQSAKAASIFTFISQERSVSAGATLDADQDNKTNSSADFGPYHSSVTAHLENPDDSNNFGTGTAQQNSTLGASVISSNGSIEVNSSAFPSGTTASGEVVFKVKFHTDITTSVKLGASLVFQDTSETDFRTLTAEIHSPLLDFGPGEPGIDDDQVLNFTQAGILTAGDHEVSIRIFGSSIDESFNTLSYAFSLEGGIAAVPLPKAVAMGGVMLGLGAGVPPLTRRARSKKRF